MANTGRTDSREAKLRPARKEKHGCGVPRKVEDERKGNLAEFLAASPLRGSGLRVERAEDLPRKVDL
jgi:hypothetical protein